MTPADLKRFAQSNGIHCIGWFTSCEFPAYLRAIEERTEYHTFDYRHLDAFLNAGRCKDVKTVIALAVDYFYENEYGKGRFKVSNYSRFCWRTVSPKTDAVIQFLRDQGHGAERIDVPARAAACKAGLGGVGKNCMFYAHGLGSHVGISTIGTDLELPEDHPGKEQTDSPLCKDCNKCINACPTKAIAPDGYRINPFRCISFINRHADEPCREMPEKTSSLNRWLHGCEICQHVCPMNADVEHERNVVLSQDIDLYGMRIPNQSTVSEEILRANMQRISSTGYREYVSRLLGDV